MAMEYTSPCLQTIPQAQAHITSSDLLSAAMLQWKRPVLSTKDSGTGEPATSAAEHGSKTKADRVKSAGKELSVLALITTRIIMIHQQVKGSIDIESTAEKMQATARILSHRNAIHMGNKITMYSLPLPPRKRARFIHYSISPKILFGVPNGQSHNCAVSISKTTGSYSEYTLSPITRSESSGSNGIISPVGVWSQ